MTTRSFPSEPLSQISTEALKQELLDLSRDRDSEPMSQKVRFYQEQLEPLVIELSQRNPYPVPAEQVPLVVGVWLPVWSTIPFQDILPGRLRDQSYQIFHSNGYYANMARYAPGSRTPLLRQLTSRLLAYDFMIVQQFAVADGRWQIKNVGIQQAIRWRGHPLDIDRADRWFSAATPTDAEVAPLDLTQLNPNIAKQSQKIAEARPYLEHLYIDPDFRLVKSQREPKQRPSYTIAVRKR